MQKKKRKEAPDATASAGQENAEVPDSQHQGELVPEDSQPVLSLDLTSPPAKIPKRKKRRKGKQAGSKATAGKGNDEALPSSIPPDGWPQDSLGEELEEDAKEDEAGKGATTNDARDRKDADESAKKDDDDDDAEAEKETEKEKLEKIQAAAKDPANMCV